METKSLTISRRQASVTNPKLVGIINKAKSMKNLVEFYDAQSELREYLLGEDCQNHLSPSQYSQNRRLYDAIVIECFEPLVAAYAKMFGRNPKPKAPFKSAIEEMEQMIG